MNTVQKYHMDENAKQLVLARLEVLPSNIGITVGNKGSYTVDELVGHIKDEDEIGVDYVKLDLDFLRAMKDGFFDQNVSLDQA